MQTNESRQPAGGPIDDFHTMTAFIKEAGPFMLKVLRFLSARVEKWEEQGGIEIAVLGFTLIKIKL